MPSLFRSPGIMDACWREWCNQDGCDLVAIATASSSAAVTANEDKNSLNSVPWQTKPNLTTQQGNHISITMKQADHLPPLIPKQMPLPLFSLSHRRRDRGFMKNAKPNTRSNIQHKTHTALSNEYHKTRFYTDKHEICTLPSPAAPGALFLPFIHVCRFSRSCRLSLFPFADLISSRDPLSHASERHEWPERREESRGETSYCYLVRKRTERRRGRGRGAALLNETVNTAASTAESGAYHMQRPGRDGGGFRSMRPHPNKPNT